VVARGILNEIGAGRSFNRYLVFDAIPRSHRILAGDGRAQKHSQRLSIVRALHHHMSTRVAIAIGDIEAGVDEVIAANIVVVVDYVMFQLPSLFVGVV